jgi:hypothetical protein
MSDEIPPPPVIYDGLDPVLEEKSVIGQVADALKGTGKKIGEAVDSDRKPGMPLSVLSNIARSRASQHPHAASRIIGRTDNAMIKNCLDESANQFA